MITVVSVLCTVFPDKLIEVKVVNAAYYDKDGRPIPQEPGTKVFAMMVCAAFRHSFVSI